MAQNITVEINTIISDRIEECGKAGYGISVIHMFNSDDNGKYVEFYTHVSLSKGNRGFTGKTYRKIMDALKEAFNWIENQLENNGTNDNN